MTAEGAPYRHADLQALRLGQLEAMGYAGFAAFAASLRQREQLPKLAYHFRKHGENCGADTEQRYRQLFLQHIQRTDLRWFTTLRRKDQVGMWYLVAMDSGLVAQYNESRKQWWSFYRPDDLDKFLHSGHGWWVEVQLGEQEAEFMRW